MRNEREKLLRSYRLWQFTERTITDRPTGWKKSLSGLRQRSSTNHREESVPGGICFAVPVFNIAKEVSVALSASFPKMRIRDSGHEKAIVATLRATSEKISTDFLASQGSALINKSRGHR